MSPDSADPSLAASQRSTGPYGEIVSFPSPDDGIVIGLWLVRDELPLADAERYVADLSAHLAAARAANNDVGNRK
ncbi:hypothetical protein [Spongiactinospora sp. TRM90649]|uniref:hypothetical protein n=1 Tax=Spongiactinospora sp. TRM90649 TaxID=3031114 RepID=UPI0023F80CCC|nr:hypothetical protein [Spongiactinospora sp. TRM90649]MDF5758780.1 hypothetical protein [Spongiactinospora sp. TRM90649]